MFPAARFRPTLVASLLSLTFALPTQASLVRDDIDYQYFRDFAENKGLFTVGASNISIYNKQGKMLGTMLPNLPMPDLRVASRTNGVAVTIDPQYIVSVTHNRGYGDVSFGNEGTNGDEHVFSYQLVARNLHSEYDYHAPRLHKLITEVAPMAVSNVPYSGKNPREGAYLNKKRFPYFVRVGSGTQAWRDADGKITPIAGAYLYLTGGASLPVSQSKDNWLQTKGDVFSDAYGPMATYGMPGDSGSSLFAYDTQEKRWVDVGVLSTYTGQNGTVNTYISSRPDMIAEIKREDSVEIRNAGKPFTWQSNGKSSTLIQNGKSTQINVYDESLISQDNSRERPSLEAGKNIHFYGKDVQLSLKNSIHQGVGALYFHTNAKVTGAQPTLTWLGGGIDVDKGKTVTWSIHNPQNDRLSKIGEGTLYVNGQGENLGDISVGDGTVILAQRALNGKQQAFRQVGITSGRATVVLQDEHQVNPDNIYFGFRGGRLDSNGNNLTFSYIQNADEGAQLVNHNRQRASTIKIIGDKLYSAENIEWLDWGNRPKSELGLYQYINPYHNQRTDYFVLKDQADPSDYFPTDATSSSSWEYLGNDKNAAINTVLSRNNGVFKARTFSGFLGENAENKTNGGLNIDYSPTQSNQLLMLNGGADLNGTLSVEGGKLLLSGRPVAHARDVLKGVDVVNENEWINRQYKATHFVAAQGGALIVGRNVARLEGNLTAKDNASIHLGFTSNQTISCVRSDYTGQTHCEQPATLADEHFTSLPTTEVFGKVTLNDQSSLNLGKSHLHGQISGGRDTTVNLGKASHWTMTGNSHLGQLHMENATITLNSQFDSLKNTQTPWKNFNRLEIDKDLSGSGTLRYLTNIAQSQGDQVVVNGKATGSFILALKNTGAEPSAVNPLSLLHVKGANQNSAELNVALENGYADLGTYRYVLVKNNNDYRLFNPLKAAEPNPAQEAAQLAAMRKQFEALKAQVQNQETKRDQLEQQYNKQLKQQKDSQKRIANLQKTVKNNQAKVNRYGYTFASRLGYYYRQALQALRKSQQNLANAQKHEKTQAQHVQQALNALNQAKRQVESVETERNSINRQIFEQEERNRLGVLERANALCLNEKLSAEICNKVVFNTSEEDLTPFELDYADKIEARQEAETALEQAQAQGEQNAITVAKARLEKAKQAETQAFETLKENINLIVQSLDEGHDPAPYDMTQANLISRYANTALSDFSATVNAALQVGQTIDRHLLSAHQSGVWVNHQWQKNLHHSDNYRPYSQQLNLTQIGVAQEVIPHLSIGAILSQSESQNSFAEGVNGKSRLTALTLYGKKQWENGLFVTLDTSLGKTRTQINYDDQVVKFQRNFANIGLNLGKQWDIAAWQVQPSVGVRYYHFANVKYPLENAQIDSPALRLIAYNAGVSIHRTFDINGLSITPSLASYYQDARQRHLNVQGSLNVNNIALNQQFGRYFKHELGLAMQFKQWQLATHFGVLTGNEINRQKYASVKLSYSWK